MSGATLTEWDVNLLVDREWSRTMVCYMCDKNATGMEHVPPRCLFPEQKDLPVGVDLRKQLITVPACDEHNTAKSRDDEYLLNILVINLPANEVAKNHFATKMMRVVQRNPRLMKQIMGDAHPVVVVDNESGKTYHTVAVNIDNARLNAALDHIARALYFYHFGEQWRGEVKTQPDFLLASLDLENAHVLNEPGEKMEAAANQIFSKAEYFGENPDVFKYQVVHGGEQASKLMRLHFYNGCRVSVFF